MHEPAACGALPAQQASLHIGPLATTEVGMLAQSIDNSSVDPSISFAMRMRIETKLCTFGFGKVPSL